MRLVVAVTGATGVIYAVKLLEALKNSEVEVHLIVSRWAKKTLNIEMGLTVSDLSSLCDYFYEENDLAASVSSGSFQHEGMVIVPCSMKTLAAIAHGFDENLIVRAAVLIGSGVKDKVAQLSGYGAGRVYLVDHQICKVPEEELYAKILSDLAETYKPKIILFGATALGRTLAPRLAARLGTGLTADCTVLDVDAEKGLLLQTRPAFGGNVMATILCPDVCPQMATVRPKVFSKGDSDAGRTCELITHDAALDRVKTKTRIKRVLPKDSDGEVRLEDAEVVVAGGAGCGSKEGFALVHQLAEALGGTVAATRPPVEEGWVDHGVQVGQTGKVIAPKLYIALGIAGAVQHAIGMQSADMIIAVNKDPDAAIFQLADIGIVGDMFEVVPQLIKQIKEKGLVVPTKQ